MCVCVRLRLPNLLDQDVRAFSLVGVLEREITAHGESVFRDVEG